MFHDTPFSDRLVRQGADDWAPSFSPWRHGGWYVDNLHYPSGAVGCVSRNYADKKWRIACDPRPFESAPTFANRDAAARGERDLIAETFALETAYRTVYTALDGRLVDVDAAAMSLTLDYLAVRLSELGSSGASALEAVAA